jgi:hypothetical protein
MGNTETTSCHETELNNLENQTLLLDKNVRKRTIISSGKNALLVSTITASTLKLREFEAGIYNIR